MNKHMRAISTKRWEEDALRQLITGHVAEKLGIERGKIDPTKAFEEYGMDSIDAVIATAAIGEKLGVELAPEFLFEHRNINAVVQGLLDLDPLRGRKVTETSVFLFPGGGGRDEPALARLRAQSLPLLNFTLVPVGDWRKWVKEDLDFAKLAALAADFIENSQGPARLIGYSQGGQLAYATALTLQQRGRNVRWVGLLDSAAPKTIEKRPKVGFRKGLVVPALDYLGARLRGKNPIVSVRGDPRNRILNWLGEVPYGPPLVMGAARLGPRMFRPRSLVRLDHHIQIRLFMKLASEWLSRTKRAKTLDVPVFLFRSEESGTPDLGWNSFCSDLRVVPVNGSHLGMLGSEHIDDLITYIVGAVSAVA